LSLKLSAAVFAPVDWSENEILTVQLAPMARVPLAVGHGLAPDATIAKSAALEPVTEMPVRLKAAEPVLVSRTVWDALDVPMLPVPKSSVGGEIVSAAGSVPFPVSNTICVAPATPPELSTN
jgi:hypothetical protein